MFVSCIRGAITIDNNAKDDILTNTENLLNEIIKENNINIENIINILFTATNDIDMAYPAVAARKIGITNAGLMCMQEMYVEGSLRMCIRVLVTINSDKKQNQVKHIYLKGAEVLRPDLIEKHIISIAIDGPAGSGKSTIAKMTAKHFNFVYADTGAMYRTVALYCIENNIDYNDSAEVEKALNDVNISLLHENNEQKIFLNNKDVTDLIRTQEVAEGSSAVAAIPCVREKLVDIQRKIAEKNSIVMDGRDIGTNVLPFADVKIYMDADVSERAKRRCGELKDKGIKFDFEQIKEEVSKRDYNDKNRKISPLCMAQDAIYVDTTNIGIEGVKNKIIEIINNKLKKDK